MKQLTLLAMTMLSACLQPVNGGNDAGLPDQACTGATPSCVSGTAGGSCGDALTQASCAAGQWACPEGTVQMDECACVGLPPASACTCSSTGWACPDAGETGCTGTAPECVSGTAGGACGDALVASLCRDGTWACPPGTVLKTACACSGPPMGACTCTPAGWSCPDGGAPVCTPDDPASCNDTPGTHRAGLCDPLGACICANGYQLNPLTGRCQ